MSFVGNTTGYAQAGFYPPASYQQAPAYAYGYPQPAYATDAYRQGYVGGMQAVSPYATQMTSAGNAMTQGSGDVFGAINGVVGTVSNLLGGVVNAVTGLFGGGSPQPTYAYQGAYYPNAYQQAYYPQAYPQQAYYQQPGYMPQQQGYMPQQGQALYGNPQLMNVIPPPPERNNVQMGPQARLQAISGDLARMSLTPMQGMTLISSHGEKAEQYRKQCENLLSKARSEMRSAVSAANTAARTGNPTKMAEAAGQRQAAFDTMRQAGELMGAVYDEAIGAQITYNLLFGPYGRMRGADGNASLQLLQSARVQWEGGKERNGWFVPTVVPPYQRYLQAYQEIDKGMQQLAAVGIR